MPKFIWGTPLEWLRWHCAGWSEDKLRQEFLWIMAELGFDYIQEKFESDMTKDGYFEPVKEE